MVVIAPPGESADGPHARTLKVPMSVWSPDGRWILEDTPEGLLRLDLATGGETRLQPAPSQVDNMELSPDGGTLYYTHIVGHVRRQLITNFADRPR